MVEVDKDISIPSRKHGHSARGAMSKTYNSWRGMIDRCRPEQPYGKLGITVCERWKVFTAFLEDMGERPEGHQIDRRNTFGNYEPDNCQWTLERPNQQQRRTTKLTPETRCQILVMRDNGMTHRTIAKLLGVSKSTITDFLNGRHWKDS